MFVSTVLLHHHYVANVHKNHSIYLRTTRGRTQSDHLEIHLCEHCLQCVLHLKLCDRVFSEYEVGLKELPF